MISKDQIHTMLLLRRLENNFFSNLPMELIVELCGYGQDPNSDIAKALHHAAYARKEDVAALIDMLETNPRLLLLAGDDELARIVQGYFDKIDDGEQERIRQYERYRPHIEGMLTQEPYDLLPLI